MAQFLRPISNTANTTAGIVGGFAQIDEATFSDADYANGTNNSNEVLEVNLTNTGITDPAVNTGHIVRWRQAQADSDAGTIAPSSGGTSTTYSVYLYQGTTLIATCISGAATSQGSFAAGSYTLSGAEADAITDYTALRLRFDLNGGGGPTANRRSGAISWAEMEIPDASATTQLTGAITTGSTVAGYVFIVGEPEYTTRNVLSAVNEADSTQGLSVTSGNLTLTTGTAPADSSTYQLRATYNTTASAIIKATLPEVKNGDTVTITFWQKIISRAGTGNDFPGIWVADGWTYQHNKAVFSGTSPGVWRRNRVMGTATQDAPLFRLHNYSGTSGDVWDFDSIELGLPYSPNNLYNVSVGTSIDADRCDDQRTTGITNESGTTSGISVTSDTPTLVQAPRGAFRSVRHNLAGSTLGRMEITEGFTLDTAKKYYVRFWYKRVTGSTGAGNGLTFRVATADGTAGATVESDGAAEEITTANTGTWTQWTSSNFSPTETTPDVWIVGSYNASDTADDFYITNFEILEAPALQLTGAITTGSTVAGSLGYADWYRESNAIAIGTEANATTNITPWVNATLSSVANDDPGGGGSFKLITAKNTSTSTQGSTQVNVDGLDTTKYYIIRIRAKSHIQPCEIYLTSTTWSTYQWVETTGDWAEYIVVNKPTNTNADITLWHNTSTALSELHVSEVEVRQSPYDDDTNLFLSKMAIDGIAAAQLYYPSVAEMDALDRLVRNLKAQGVWTSINALYPFFGKTSESFKWNLKDAQNLDASFRITWNLTGIVYDSLGVKFDGSTGHYGDTHYIPNDQVTFNSESILFYCNSNESVVNSDQIEVGAYTSSSQASFLSARGSGTGNPMRARFNQTVISATNTDARGSFFVGKNGNTTTRLIKNGVQVASATDTASATAANSVHIGKLNLAAYTNGYSNQRLAAVVLADGLSNQTVAVLEIEIDRYQKALNRASGVDIYGNIAGSKEYPLSTNEPTGTWIDTPAGTTYSFVDSPSGENQKVIKVSSTATGGLIFNGNIMESSVATGETVVMTGYAWVDSADVPTQGEAEVRLWYSGNIVTGEIDSTLTDQWQPFAIRHTRPGTGAWEVVFKSGDGTVYFKDTKIINENALVTPTGATTLQLTGAITTSSTVAGSLVASEALSGAVSTSSTVAGNISATTALTGAITTSSTVAGDIVSTESLAGAITTSSTVAGSLVASSALTGAVAGSSTVAGQIVASAALTGAVAGSSTVAGALDIAGSSAALTGSVITSSTAAGSLTSIEALSGTVTGGSTISGLLAAKGSLESTVSGLSAVAGDLVASAALTGAVAGSSVVAGGLDIAGSTASLSGTSPGSSTVAGSLVASAALSGAVATSSTVAGQIVASEVLSGAVATSSTVAGQIVASAALTGAVAGSSTVAGGLDIAGSTAALTGSVLTSSTVAGQIVASAALSGAVAGSSTVAGGLDIAGTTASLSGSITTSSAVSGQIVLTAALTGAIAASSTVAGGLATTETLAGTSAGVSTVAANLTAFRYVDGTVAGSSTVVGSLTSIEGLAGSVFASTSASGDLVLYAALEGFIVGITVTEGNLRYPAEYKPLSVSITGVKNSVPLITGQKKPISAITGQKKSSIQITGKNVGT